MCKVIILRPPTLTGHSFEASWAMMMKSSSFESPKPYLFAQYLKNSIQALLRYVIIAQSNPILYHTEENWCIFFWLAVQFMRICRNKQTATNQISMALRNTVMWIIIQHILILPLVSFITYMNIIIIVIKSSNWVLFKTKFSCIWYQNKSQCP